MISVIVPVYNAQTVLRYCVDSILDQSHQNLELILVDDGSTDDSPRMCDDYAAHDPRVRVIHQPNGGIAVAQNTGLDAARGTYIAFADNDDILDRHNLELLLHALESTGADMSKARWRQFGVSQLEAVAAEAARGAAEPPHVTVFRNPLRAYQTVFCKSLRLAGDRLGRKTETRYFNEANWCRLYRRELWDGVRFPEGMYAQDVMVAGELYSRMHKVADIDVVLYHWLQSASSVTHNERSFGYYHDNVAAGVANFAHALDEGIVPARSYYTMTTMLADEPHAHDADDPGNRACYERDRAAVRALLSRLTPAQRVHCATLAAIRLAEKQIYDRKIKNMR
ncbi:glycosyltransferase family 2 protein [Bifidobacterium goeldii]|uniref:glycosyltransferase family 2 protein n=1 Tax=Bifidobacterium goeldii TaxID=2306975 RepID=UPI001F49E221|nr:glycosyltransferase [Bifidobacterium goeldii]